MNYNLDWQQPQHLASKSYTCGHCGSEVASEKGFHATWLDRARGRKDPKGYIYICHKCTYPTFLLDEYQNPGVAFGKSVRDISDESVAKIYSEARHATSAGSYTAAVLCCRKLLMHIAVSKGANAGDSFASYVDFLAKKNYVPPDAREWVDHIRDKGNEANHEIKIMGKQDAEELLNFAEMLLKLVYEFPAVMKRKYPSKSPAAPVPSTP